MKIYIIGNMKSGKSFLAKKLSKELNIPHLDLDTIFWKVFAEEKNPRAVILDKLREFMTSNDDWIIDGVYRSLERFITGDADSLIYMKTIKELNVEWSPEDKKEYVSSYFNGKRFSHGSEIYSEITHEKVFEKFTEKKQKVHIRSKNSLEINTIVNKL